MKSLMQIAEDVIWDTTNLKHRYQRKINSSKETEGCFLINTKRITCTYFVFQFKNKWDNTKFMNYMKDRIRQQMIKHPNHLLWDKRF
jgi:hypothetical protein